MAAIIVMAVLYFENHS
ncbi:hypothetical protein ACOB6F_000996 [Escherichia coli]